MASRLAPEGSYHLGLRGCSPAPLNLSPPFFRTEHAEFGGWIRFAGFCGSVSVGSSPGPRGSACASLPAGNRPACPLLGAQAVPRKPVWPGGGGRPHLGLGKHLRQRRKESIFSRTDITVPTLLLSKEQPLCSVPPAPPRHTGFFVICCKGPTKDPTLQTQKETWLGIFLSFNGHFLMPWKYPYYTGKPYG